MEEGRIGRSLLFFLLLWRGQAQEDTTELQAQKAELDAKVAQLAVDSKDAEEAMRKKAQQIGNIVHESVPISATEVSWSLGRSWRNLG